MQVAPYHSKQSFQRSKGKRVILQSLHEAEAPRNGHFSVFGPSEFNSRWSAEVSMRNGQIVSIS
jgi:hypothetical protein